MKTVVVIQARAGSTRLPRKALLELGGIPMLAWAVERTRAAPGVAEVVVATTTEPADDETRDLCRSLGFPCFRGSENDVLSRYVGAAREHQADVVVRVTSDCPFIDPALLQQHLDELIGAALRVDYVTNMWEPTFPLGLAVEVVPRDVLERMHRLAELPRDREHVTSFIRYHRDLFRVVSVQHPEDLHTLRWTVDTPDDLRFARAVVERLPGRGFAWTDVLDLVRAEPSLAAINAHIAQKAV